MERKIGERNYLNENWIKADKSISEYPIGTKFKSINGGYWIKTERGYKWCTGATFPRVGGDYMGLVCLPEKQVTMERKIGEIFEYNGEWYQCVEGETICSECDLRNIICQRDTNINNPFKGCSGNYRTDKRTVIFKKLEKVGEPFTISGTLYQHYKVFDIDNVCGDGFWCVHNYKAKTLTIEIKQNKEDMEEKKLNLKPFDIQKAREGKPVCTRDGRKARIICFDAKDTQPIIGLYEKNIDGIVREYLCSYHTDGRMYDDQDTGYDLMMLPEKKEGWAKIRKDINLYDTKEEADRKMIGNDEYVTAKVCWEE